MCVLAALVLLVGAYVAYVFIAFNRLPDDLQLTVTDNVKETAQVNTAYKVVSFNTGFDAYEPDYSFF
ncbi:MAG: hydrolase, partial [Clostridia bacterium]|nr:hydrolase [Clostridia bacterium]